MQLFDLQFVLDSNLMDFMTEIDHLHDNNLSCFQVLTPKIKHRSMQILYTSSLSIVPCHNCIQIENNATNLVV